MRTTNFDSLPDSGFVSDLEVASLLGISRATVWRSARAGRLPKLVKLTARASRMNVGELRRALAAKAA